MWLCISSFILPHTNGHLMVMSHAWVVVYIHFHDDLTHDIFLCIMVTVLSINISIASSNNINFKIPLWLASYIVLHMVMLHGRVNKLIAQLCMVISILERTNCQYNGFNTYIAICV